MTTNQEVLDMNEEHEVNQMVEECEPWINKTFNNQGVIDISRELLKRKEFHMVDMRAMLYEKAKYYDCFSSERRTSIKEALDHLFAIDVKNFNETDFYSLGIETARVFRKEWGLWHNLFYSDEPLNENEQHALTELQDFLLLVGSGLIPERKELSDKYKEAFQNGQSDFLKEMMRYKA